MGSAVPETGGFPVSIIAPDPGDVRNAASVRTGFEDAAQRTRHLKANIPMWAELSTDGGGNASVVASSLEDDGTTAAISGASIDGSGRLVITFATNRTSASYFSQGSIGTTGDLHLVPTARANNQATFQYLSSGTPTSLAAVALTGLMVLIVGSGP